MLYPELDDIIRYSADESLLMALVKRGAKTRRLASGEIKVSLRLRPKENPAPKVRRRRRHSTRDPYGLLKSQ